MQKLIVSSLKFVRLSKIEKETLRSFETSTSVSKESEHDTKINLAQTKFIYIYIVFRLNCYPTKA